MRILELFAGSRSFSKEAIKQGHETYTSDYKQFEGIDYVTDILDFDIKKLKLRTEKLNEYINFKTTFQEEKDKLD